MWRIEWAWKKQGDVEREMVLVGVGVQEDNEKEKDCSMAEKGK